jgi:nucleoside-diphosphate-sugar epimerase
VRALVTGSAGFVGRHMVAELARRGWNVSGVDLVPTAGFRAWCGDANDVFRGNYYPGERFDLVVHCAYRVGGRAAIDGEPRNLAKNLELDAAMFDWAVTTGQRAVLYFSSSAAYPVRLQTAEWVGINGVHLLAEDDINLHQSSKTGDWTPDARYGWAKLTGEKLAEAAAETGLLVHVVRPFSGYGEDQNPDEYPFPAIVRRAAAGDLSVWGPPGQRRDWIHIDDVVRGALAVVDADERRPVNLCTGLATEFGDLAQLVWRAGQLADGICPSVRYQPERPTGVMCRVGDPARMFGIYWPRVTIEEGIRRALAELETPGGGS